MKVNPLFYNKNKIKVQSSASPIDHKEMKKITIYSTDGREIPVEIDIENRVCLPIQSEG